jgi:hypothetical protein
VVKLVAVRNEGGRGDVNRVHLVLNSSLLFVSDREQAEARANELQGQVDQLEQDLIFLEAKYKENVAKAATKPAEDSKRTAEIAKLKEALESKTHQADVAKELVLQFMENEREKDFELKQLKREAAYAKERLAELERKFEVSAASRIEGALDGSKGGAPGDESALERARFEQQLEGFRQDSEAEIAGLRSDLKSARDQLARAQKQHGMEMEAKLGKQERQHRLQISVRESERDGCLVKLGSLEEELALEVQARAQARRELSNAQEQVSRTLTTVTEKERERGQKFADYKNGFWNPNESPWKPTEATFLRQYADCRCLCTSGVTGGAKSADWATIFQQRMRSIAVNSCERLRDNAVSVSLYELLRSAFANCAYLLLLSVFCICAYPLPTEWIRRLGGRAKKSTFLQLSLSWFSLQLTKSPHAR